MLALISCESNAPGSVVTAVISSGNTAVVVATVVLAAIVAAVLIAVLIAAVSGSGSTHGSSNSNGNSCSGVSSVCQWCVEPSVCTIEKKQLSFVMCF